MAPGSANSPSPGDPIPDGLPERVVGPSGAPCYREDRVREIFGVGSRRIGQIVKAHPEIRDPDPNSRRAYYLCDEIHARAGEMGRPLPTMEDPYPGESTRLELFAARLRIAELETQVALLEADNADLRNAVQSLGSVVGRGLPGQMSQPSLEAERREGPG